MFAKIREFVNPESLRSQKAHSSVRNQFQDNFEKVNF